MVAGGRIEPPTRRFQSHALAAGCDAPEILVVAFDIVAMGACLSPWQRQGLRQANE